MKNLYLIGNGFDLHHNIKSGYPLFHEWLKKHDEDLYEEFLNFYPDAEVDEWWSEMEERFGDGVDFEFLEDYISKTAAENEPNYGSDDFRDADYHTASIYAEERLRNLVEGIKSHFGDWINNLDSADVTKKVNLVINDSYFINFNYTPTLENTYNIPANQIIHIHGSIFDNHYELGHGRSYRDLMDEAEKLAPKPPVHDTDDEDAYSDWDEFEGEDYIKTSTREAAIDGIAKLRKDVKGIIAKNHELFSSLQDVERVTILGMSFGPVDMPYIEKIFYSVKKDTQWTFSYYSAGDDIRFKNILRTIGVPDSNIHAIQLTPGLPV